MSKEKETVPPSQVSGLTPAETVNLLENLILIPDDIIKITLDECKERGWTPSTKILHFVLQAWLKKNPEASELHDNFILIDKQITIISSTISLWYRDLYGYPFNAFAETDHVYYVLVTYADGETRIRVVEKIHAE